METTRSRAGTGERVGKGLLVHMWLCGKENTVVNYFWVEGNSLLSLYQKK